MKTNKRSPNNEVGGRSMGGGGGGTAEKRNDFSLYWTAGPTTDMPRIQIPPKPAHGDRMKTRLFVF